MGTEHHISPKHALEICNAIRGMRAEAAKAYVEEVIAKKRPVPFKHHNKKVPHRHGLVGWDAASTPRRRRGPSWASWSPPQQRRVQGAGPRRDEDNPRLHQAGEDPPRLDAEGHGQSHPQDTETVSIEMILTEVS
jgi:large subunit ribosomal protein L22